MPMVNGKEFAYTTKGMKAAKMEAKKTGKKMVVKKTAKKKAVKRGLFGNKKGM